MNGERRDIGGHAFARFLRHSVHALGVTTPRPLRLLDDGLPEAACSGALGVPVDVEEVSSCAGVPAAVFGRGRGGLRGPLVGVEAEPPVAPDEGLRGGDCWASCSGESSSIGSISEGFSEGAAPAQAQAHACRGGR